MTHRLTTTVLSGAALFALAACSAADGGTSQSAMADQPVAHVAKVAQSQAPGETMSPDKIAIAKASTSADAGPIAGDEAARPELIKAAVTSFSDKMPAKNAASGTAASFPDPKVDAPTSGPNQIAVLSGGCFWTQEAVFEHIKGVTSVVSGYAGGSKDTATYEQVATRKTGHAETVRITFDPSQVSYGHLLKIFFAASHDPTQVNRQGPDTGSDYRSAIFPQNARQRAVATAYIAQLGKAGVFDKPIATKIESGTFYRAEDSHQNFVERHPQHPYVVAWDVAKLAKLHKAFPSDWRNGTTS